MAIALDNSGSISSGNFEDQKTFAEKFMQVFHPSTTGTHTSLITYSTDAQLAWNINSRESSNCDAGIIKLKSITKLHHPQKCMEKVFNVARTKIFTHKNWRSGIKRILVLISDGDGNCVDMNKINAEAQSLKAAGVKIMTIVVGKDPNEHQLKTLASKPETFFSIPNFEQLTDSVMTMAVKACEISYLKKIYSVSHSSSYFSSYALRKSSYHVKMNTNGRIFYYGILLENSNMVTREHFDVIKTLPKTVHDMLDFSSRGSQISVMFYSETPKMAVRFGDPGSYDARSLDSVMQRATLSHSSKSCSCIAYEKISEGMFSKAPSAATKILIVALTSSDNCGGVARLQFYAEKIKESGVVIFVLSLGDNINKDELISMSSGGANILHVEQISNFATYIHTIIQRSVTYKTSNAIRRTITTSSEITIVQKFSQATDIVVVFENSARLRDMEFHQIKLFLEGMIMSNTMSATHSRIAFVSYGTSARVLWDLNSPNAIDSLRAMEAIRRLPQSTDEQACYEEGLDVVASRVYTENTIRANTPRILIFSASNPSNCRGIEEIARIASDIKQRQITILTVAHFGRPLASEITSIASSSDYYWEIYSDSQISSVLNLMVVTMIKISSSSGSIKNDYPAKKNSVDLGFILTDSATIADLDFRKLMSTIVLTISQLEISHYASRVSIMINDLYPHLLWDFSAREATSLNLIKSSLASYQRTTHTTSCLDTALEKARVDMFNANFQRVGVHKILIIITSESTTCNEEGFITEATLMLRNSGVYIAVLAIGTTVNQNSLKLIATTHRFYFYYLRYGIYKLTLTQLIVYISKDEIGIDIEEERTTTPAPDVSTRPPPIIVRSACKIDLGIIIDESLSISTHDFDSSKNFILELIRMLQPAKNQAHTSLMAMSNSGRMIYRFIDDEGYSYQAAHSTITDIRQLKGPATCYGNALRSAQYEMFSPENTRSDSYKVLVVLSNDGSDCTMPEKEDYHSISKDIKKRNIVIYTIGYGGQKDDSVLKAISSSPDHTHSTISDIGEFTSRVGGLITQYCSGNEYPIQERDEEMHCNTRIAFLLDTSFSTHTEIQALTESISTMIRYLFTRYNHDENKVTSQTSLITYNEQANVVWAFESFEAKDFPSSHAKLADVSNTPGMRSCVSHALQIAKDQLFSRKSQYALSTDAVFIIGKITDDCGDRQRIVQLTSDLNRENVNVFIVGVGESGDTSFYSEITTEKSYFYRINVAPDFTDMTHYWINFICRVPPRTRKIVTPMPTPPPQPPVVTTTTKRPVVPIFFDVDSCNTRTLFVLDEGLITEESFNDLKETVYDMIRRIMRRANKDANAITSRTALLTFSDSVSILWDFASPEATNAQLAIDKLTSYAHKTSKFSCHDRALKPIGKIFSNSFPNENAAYNVFFVTSGENTCNTQQEAKLIARQIFTSNIYIILVTVGDAVREQEVQDIAAAPNFYIERGKYSELYELTRYFTEMICRIPPTVISWRDLTTTPAPRTPTPIPVISTTTPFIPTPPEPIITTPPIIITPSPKPEPSTTTPAVIPPKPIITTTPIIITPSPRPEPSTTTPVIIPPEPIITTPPIIITPSPRPEPSTTTPVIIPPEPIITTTPKIITPSPRPEPSTTTPVIIPPEPIITTTPMIITPSPRPEPTTTTPVIIPPEPIITTTPMIITPSPRPEPTTTTPAIIPPEPIITTTPMIITPSPRPAPTTTTPIIIPPEPIPSTPAPHPPPPPPHPPSPPPHPPKPRPPVPPPPAPPSPPPHPPKPRPPVPPPPAPPSPPPHPPRPRPPVPPPPAPPSPPPTPPRPRPPPPSPPRPRPPTPIYPPPRKHHIRIVLKICKDLLVRPVGCLNSNYFQYFNHPLNKPLCLSSDSCQIPLKALKDAFCECSKRSRFLGQNSFALAANGQCFGNHFLHKISRGSVLSNENCQRHDLTKCKDSDHTCLGSGNTLYVYSNA